MPGRVVLARLFRWPRERIGGNLCAMSNVDAGSVVRRFYEGWNSGSIDFSGLVAEDIVNHQPEAEPEQGQQRFEEAIRNVMRAVPDSHWTVTDLLTDGDRVAARTTWSGTYQAQMFRGITIPAPARFSVEHVHIYRIQEGRLIEHWVVRDDLTMLRQLGAIPNQSSSD
jgi:steroid delta-isomerase-like uncharacterized protein